MYSRVKHYFSVLIVLAIIYAMGSAIYDEVTKTNPYAKSSRIVCQIKKTTFERVYKKEEIKAAQNQLKSGNYLFTSSVLKSIYAKSKLFDYVKLSDMDSVLNKTLNLHVKKKIQTKDKLNISYYIYENDVKDPGKKTEKSKLYAGYVLFKFKNEKEELIYQVQVDFMDKKGKDITQSIKCAVKSFVTL